jgi:thiol-disulfide isomerase/thioredoxin
MLELGVRVPQFRLPDLSGAVVTSDSAATSKGLLVAFLCPHCPYVKHVRGEFARAAQEFRQRGLGVVAVNSNDTIAVPDDGVDGMRQEVREAGYTFPYLMDESQEVAKAFRAACTPDFFLFDGAGKLVYRGQFDGSRPGSQLPVTGGDLRAAVDALLTGQAVSADQRPSLGCNIKWKKGSEPDYFGG